MGKPPQPLRQSDVVFMHCADRDAYRAYGATFVAWGGTMTPERVAEHHEAGLRCAGSMWCLTARAKLLHDRSDLREAVARDITGEPVLVPWQFDATHRGTPTWFGCTNHPTFRQWTREQVREVLTGKPDGLHVDDHLGTATASWLYGGGFCDHCMAAFRDYLRRHASPAELATAGVKRLEGFDYRSVVRAMALSREEYLRTRQIIPLMHLFDRFQVEAAAENLREIGELATELLGPDRLLSVNACLPWRHHLRAMEYATHAVGEVPQHANVGTTRSKEALLAYRAAEAMGKPLCATAHGWDWAYAKSHDLEELVRYWIALAYAHGQRFMVPHPTRQWAYTPELGQHGFVGRIEAFAPLYRFVRANAEYFDDYAAADADIEAPDTVIASLRSRPGRPDVLHIVNRDYVGNLGAGWRRKDAMRPAENVGAQISGLGGAQRRRATLLSYNAEPQTVDIEATGDGLRLTIPELRLWTVAVLE